MHWLGTHYFYFYKFIASMHLPFSNNKGNKTAIVIPSTLNFKHVYQFRDYKGTRIALDNSPGFPLNY